MHCPTRRTFRRGRALRQGLALLLPFLLSAAPAGAGALDTPDQLRLEAQTLRLLETPALRAAMARAAETYRADPAARSAGGRASLEGAVAALAAASVQQAINADPARPAMLWTVHAPHRWHGLAVPGSGYGIDNPDNVYRSAAIDGRSRYVVTGQLPARPATQLSFTLTGAPPPGPFGREGPPVQAGLSDIEAGPDGRFTVTIDPSPADGRRNHLQSTAATTRLTVRDTFADWSALGVTPLSIRRVDGPPAGPEPTPDALAARAAAALDRQAAGWADYFQREVYTAPANQVPPPVKRDGGWGFATMAHYRLAPGEALLVTLDSLGARYVGFQLSDPWGVAPDYVTRSSSLTNRQATPNPDGTITYVIALADPGVANWLDPVGLADGMLCIRWQGLAPGTDAAGAVRSARLVTLADLKAAAPNLAAVSPEQRRRQLAERAAHYARRLTD